MKETVELAEGRASSWHGHCTLANSTSPSTATTPPTRGEPLEGLGESPVLGGGEGGGVHWQWHWQDGLASSSALSTLHSPHNMYKLHTYVCPVLKSLFELENGFSTKKEQTTTSRSSGGGHPVAITAT